MLITSKQLNWCLYQKQIVDQGVIEALKAFYRTSVARRHIKYINPGETFPNISILETVRVLVKSWYAVTSNTVKNCFRKADISPGNKGCKYRGWRWFIQNACRKCQWSRCLIDENLRLTITEHTFSSLYEWSTCYGRSRNSRFRFKWRLCRGGRGENDVPPEKPKYLRLQAL